MPDVTFFSDQFSETLAHDAINEMLGHDLAGWLRDGLMAAGFEIGEVIPEDYGYGFWLEIESSHYWITQTQYEPAGFKHHAQPGWLVGIHYDPGCLYFLRLRHHPGSGDLPRIAQAVHALLVTEPTINGIQWWGQGVGNGTPTSEPPPLPEKT